MTGGETVLPAPAVDGVRDGELSPDALAKGTTIRVPGVGQLPGDTIVISWVPTLKGRFGDNLRIGPSMAGQPLATYVPAENVRASVGGFGPVRVWYTLEHNGVSVQSETLSFRIRDPHAGPARPLEQQLDDWVAGLPAVPWRARIARLLRMRRA
jgi:hypothetical protein